MPEIEIRQIAPEDTLLLRQQLLRQGMPLDALVYPGDLEPDALHVGAFVDGEHVGIATVMRQPPNISRGTPPTHPDPDNMTAFRLRGMATSQTLRNAGLGTRMLEVCIGHVAAQDGDFLWCDARIAAVNFYRKNGFTALGDEYHVPTVGPHYFMQRDSDPADVALIEKHLGTEA